MQSATGDQYPCTLSQFWVKSTTKTCFPGVCGHFSANSNNHSAQLKAAGKGFQYKIYKDAPGGHSFNRLDTPLARESRKEIYSFLDKYLK
jgi:acetyl esterase/lipase